MSWPTSLSNNRGDTCHIKYDSGLLNSFQINLTKLRGMSPRANYTDRATAANFCG
jgi:hypothetical protein